MPPHILDRIKFGRVSGQPLDDEAASRGRHIVFDQHAPVDGGPIPDDQQFPRQVPLEVVQKIHHLETFDAARMDLEIKPPQRQAANNRKTFPIEGLVQHRSLPTWRPGACTRWTSAQSAFVNKDYGSTLLPGLFLRRAIRFVASDGWPARRVPPLGVPVVGS